MSRAKSIGITFGALVAAGLATAIATGLPGGGPNDGDPVQIAPRRAQVVKLGSTPTAAVAALDRRLDLVYNVRVEKGTVPDENDAGAAEILTLRYDLAVPSFNGPDVSEALWQGNLLVGAATDQYATFELPIGAAEATLVALDGNQMPVGGGVGSVVRDQDFDAPPTSATAAMKSAASTLGLTGLTTGRVRAIGDALVVRARTTRQVVRAFLTDRAALESLLDGSPARYEGVFVDIRDEITGEPLFRFGSAPEREARQSGSHLV